MKLAVHLHLYYLDQLPEILVYLKSLDGQNYDLFVTMVAHDAQAEKALKAIAPTTKIMIVPNYGYDVGPFIEFLHKIDLDKYDCILKIHTKGHVSKNRTRLNGNRMNNRLWKTVLFDALLKDPERVQSNLLLLQNNPQIGILSSKYCITQEKRTYKQLLPQINQALIKCGFHKIQQVQFVAGTMFYVRAKLFKPLLKYTINDFSESNSQIKEGTFAHVMERLLGAIVTAQGYRLYGLEHDNYTRKFILAAIGYFLFQKKQTEHRLLIKICKIPVWSKKL